MTVRIQSFESFLLPVCQPQVLTFPALIIGSKQQAESFIDYLNHNGNDKEAIFSCDVFGRKLGDLIEEGMYYKLNMIPENASLKIHDILSKIVNKGKSNVIAIVL